MQTILLLFHMLIAVALVGVVLMQKSEGGGLGIGGGGSGGGGGFMTGRGTANFLTRVTAALAIAFFITSISLTLLARHGVGTSVSPLDAAGKPSAGGVLDSLQKGKQKLPPAVPKSE